MILEVLGDQFGKGGVQTAQPVQRLAHDLERALCDQLQVPVVSIILDFLPFELAQNMRQSGPRVL